MSPHSRRERYCDTSGTLQPNRGCHQQSNDKIEKRRNAMLSRRWVGLVLLVLSVCLNAPLRLRAQEVRARLGGTVTDSSSAVVAGATLTLKNEQTGVQFTATSNES